MRGPLSYIRTLFVIAVAAAAWPALFVSQIATQGTAVPFVGCKSVGQADSFPPPKVPDRVIRIDANAARRLTYYKAEFGYGVLGPSGWNCYEISGSSGASLYVTPKTFDIESLFSNVTRITGPAIELTSSHADTSGRFEIASVVARVFPAHKDFVQSVIDLGVARSRDFPSGPYPTDRLVYRGDRIVEYETPAGSTGLGTRGRLQQNNDPIRGVAILQSEGPDLLLLTMRLPPDMRDLVTNIIRQLEQGP